jgi:hypothetical protein
MTVTEKSVFDGTARGPFSLSGIDTGTAAKMSHSLVDQLVSIPGPLKASGTSAHRTLSPFLICS